MESKIKPASNAKFPDWVYGLIPVLAVVLFYLPVLDNGFIDLDDPENITNNPGIRSLGFSSLRWMFTTNLAGYWMPLTWLSDAVNYSIAGLNPWIYHFTNALIHVLNTFLVFLISRRLLGSAPAVLDSGGLEGLRGLEIPAAILTALLFGLHPIHVESVAWATERKDVLYAFFFLLALLSYLDYGKSLDRKWKLYACLGFYLLSLMSKPMAITLPLVLLILDFWPLRRFQPDPRKVLVEKIPFFVLALSFSLVTRLEMGQIKMINPNFSPWLRMVHVCHSLGFYIYKMAVPMELVPVYPFPHLMGAAYYLESALGGLVVILISLACYYYKQKFPFLPAAWIYFLITLAPVIGFVQIGSFAAGDRYTYLPSLGLFLPFSAGAAFLFSGNKKNFGVLITLMALLLGFGTLGQIGIWKSAQTLWDSLTRVYPAETRDVLLNNGNLLLNAGKTDEALNQYKRAAGILPAQAAVHERIAYAYMIEGRIDEAIMELKEAIKINTATKELSQVQLRHDLWYCYKRQGSTKEALEETREDVKEEPDNALAYFDMGVSYFDMGSVKDAEAAFQTACRLDPFKPDYLDTLASMYQKLGRTQEAVAAYKKGIMVNPKEPVFFLKLADLYLDLKEKPEALEMLKSASDLNPSNPQVLQLMGTVYDKAGEKDLAQQCIARAQSSVPVVAK